MDKKTDEFIKLGEEYGGGCSYTLFTEKEEKIKEAVENYFDNLAQYNDHRSADASSQESLDARYKVLSDILPKGKDLQGISTLDVGCGVGGFYNYLLGNDYMHDGLQYMGIDISEKQIEKAKRIQGKTFRFWKLDVLVSEFETIYDYFMSQGIFYKIPDNHMETTLAMIEKMFSLCKVATAFTFICNFGFNSYDNDEFRPDAFQIFRFCQTLTDKVVLRADYWPGDACIYLYK